MSDIRWFTCIPVGSRWRAYGPMTGVMRVEAGLCICETPLVQCHDGWVRCPKSPEHMHFRLRPAAADGSEELDDDAWVHGPPVLPYLTGAPGTPVLEYERTA